MLPSYVPDDLARLPQWVFWRYDLNERGGLTKVPYQIDAWHMGARSTDADTWSTLDNAYRDFGQANVAGIGFVFQKGGNIFGIDVDDLDKVAPEDREAAEQLRVMIHEAFPTYCERSPSGKGVHYIGRGAIPETIGAIKDSKYGIEIYDHDRFFTFTGDTYPNRDRLLDCGTPLLELCQTMRGAASATQSARVHDDVRDERTTDQIISDIRSWTNGAEFSFLMDNNLPTVLSRFKQDHSAADLALCNFIASGTKDTAKAIEIFSRSSLWRAGGKGGYKPENKYIDDYLIGKNMAKVWGENVVKEQQRAVAAEEGKAIAQGMVSQARIEHANSAQMGSALARMHKVDLPHLDIDDKSCPFPPGVAGMYIKAIHDACATPVPEFALSVGMAFASGLLGRAYRFGNEGINTFWIVAAKSATGKTQSLKALKRLLGGVTDAHGLKDRMYSVSGKTVQGMQTYFEKYPAGSWITDECGAQVRALTSPQAQGDHELKDAINALYDAAVPGETWSPPASRASQREDKSITCLSVGIGWFTTREKVYSALGDAEVADGFLSRFIPVLYEGSMGEDNFDPVLKFPDKVSKTFSVINSVVVENDVHMPVDGIGNVSKMVQVRIAERAKQMLTEFGAAARTVTRRAQSDADDLPEMFVAMGRVSMTAQRLAAVCAVLDNPTQPMVSEQHVKWAIQLVGSRMLNILDLMQTGVVGTSESKSVEVVVRTITRELKRKQDPNGVRKSYVVNLLRGLLPFKESKIGGYAATRQVLKFMVEDGMLALHTPPTEGKGRPTEYYLPTNDPIWR